MPDKSFKEFSEEQSAAEAAGLKARIEDAPPPGMLPDGKLNVVEAGSAKQEPEVIEDDEEDVDDISDIDDDLP